MFRVFWENVHVKKNLTKTQSKVLPSVPCYQRTYFKDCDKSLFSLLISLFDKASFFLSFMRRLTGNRIDRGLTCSKCCQLESNRQHCKGHAIMRSNHSAARALLQDRFLDLRTSKVTCVEPTSSWSGLNVDAAQLGWTGISRRAFNQCYCCFSNI